MKSGRLPRAIASLVVLCLASQAALADVAQSSVWSERQQKRSASENPLFAALPTGMPALGSGPQRPASAIRGVAVSPGSPLFGTLAAIPNDRLNVVEVVQGTGHKSPIVLIQDVHLNSEAQLNIAAAIERLSKETNVGGVYLEGAFGALDFTQLRAIPANIRTPLGEAMLRHGRMGGPSLAALDLERMPAFVGADEEKPFRDNANVVIDATAARAAAEKAVTEYGRLLTEAKKTGYGPAMASYDRLLDGYRSGAVSLGEFVTRLDAAGMPTDIELRRFLDAYRYEKSLDIPKVERERRAILEKLAAKLTDKEVSELIAESVAYRDGRIGFAAYHERLESLCSRHQVNLALAPAFKRYLDYVALADKIDVSRLIVSLDGGQRRLIEMISTTAAERELAQKDAGQYLAAKLVRFELTPTEWHQWTSLKTTLVDTDLKTANLPLFERFYGLADQRSQILAAAVLKSSEKTPAILVAGGFHTEGLVRALAASGRPVIVAAPKITSVPDSGTRYLDAFTREKTPLDRIFAGEKLTLNPPGQVLGSATGEGRWRRLEFLARAAASLAAIAQLIPAPMNATAKPAGKNVFETRVEDVTAFVATGPHDANFVNRDETPINNTTVVSPEESLALPSAPGAWALIWYLPIKLVGVLFGPKWEARMRPVISGVGEGTIAAIVALTVASSPASGATLIAAWLIANLIMHYVFGVYRYNRAEQRWDVQRFIMLAKNRPKGVKGITVLGIFFAAPSRHFWRANFVAITSSLAFSAAAFGAATLPIFLLAILPHVAAGFTRERRIGKQRYQLTEDRKAKFAENLHIRDVLDQSEVPIEIDRQDVLDALEYGNDLASIIRYAQSGLMNYRLVMLMQPGSVSDEEGVGFKMFNDILGQDLMNRVWRYRNEYMWAKAQELFAEAEARAGKPILVRIAGNYKSFRFAVDMDALQKGFGLKGAALDAKLSGLLNELTDDIKTHIHSYMTELSAKNERLGNSEIADAVHKMQKAGKLPKTIKATPVYWGMSVEPRNVTPGEPMSIDEILSQDAQALNAINTLRAEPLAKRGLGASFSFKNARKTLREIMTDRAYLMRPGREAIVVRKIPGRSDEFRLAPEIVEVLRKDAKKLPYVLAQRFKGASDAEIQELTQRVTDYVAKLMSFDVIKPWVGTKEKPKAIKLAGEFNEALRLMHEMEATAEPGAKKALWDRARAAATKALRQDGRMPDLGGNFEFYGGVSRDPAREDEAIVFIDFRGFGALIVNELEATAELLAAIPDDQNDLFLETFNSEMNTLGNRSLDVFADALREMKDVIDAHSAGESKRFYFGGDDISVVFPRRLVYDENGQPRADFLAEVFSKVPSWMRIRINIGSTAPYHRADPVLETSLALTSMKELGDDAKVAEAGWIVGGKLVNQVVTFTDKNGARFRKDGAFGEPELVQQGFDDHATQFVKWLISLRARWTKTKTPLIGQRDWAEAKAEESVVVLGALVALFELPLIPILPLFFVSTLGLTGAIFAGAFLIIVFHEGARGLAYIREERALARGEPVNRPPPSESLVDHWAVRVAVRSTVTLAILWFAFLPIIPAVTAGTFTFWTFSNFPVLLMAYHAHALWNSFAPASWRLNLFGDLFPNRLTRTLTDTDPILRVPMSDGTPAGSRRRLIAVASALPVKLGVENADRPSWSVISTAVSQRVDSWVATGELDEKEAAVFGRTFAEDMRRSVTGEDEVRTDLPPGQKGLTLSSESALYDQAAREREAQELVDVFAYRIIKAPTAAQASKDADAAIAASSRLGAGHSTLVVEGQEAYDAVVAKVAAKGKTGLVQVILLKPEMTMKDLQDLTVTWLDRQNLLTRDAANAAMQAASFRIVLPDPKDFTLPPGFLTGQDLTRYRVYLAVQIINAVLAVEIRPDNLENAQALALLVAKQA